jgi:hypothetical protein
MFVDRFKINDSSYGDKISVHIDIRLTLFERTRLEQHFFHDGMTALFICGYNEDTGCIDTLSRITLRMRWGLDDITLSKADLRRYGLYRLVSDLLPLLDSLEKNAIDQMHSLMVEEWGYSWCPYCDCYTRINEWEDEDRTRCAFC